jgi:ParB family chromosome partitioning protein
MTRDSVLSILIDEINILNPRVRDQTIADEIRHNIRGVGLKRPITVRRRESTKNGKKYDLVCGQGRLEAFVDVGEEEIPAIIIEVGQEDAHIMSLAENIARRNNNSLELLQSIKYLKTKGYEENEIASKTGLGRDYIHGIIKLLEKGEDRLVNLVEKGRMSLHLALKIMSEDDVGIQRALTEAYESGELSGGQLVALQKQIDRRKYCGKGMGTSAKQKIKFSSKEDLMAFYEKELTSKKRLVAKSNQVKQILAFSKAAFNELLHDIHFVNQLKAELLTDIPKSLADLTKEIE